MAVNIETMPEAHSPTAPVMPDAGPIFIDQGEVGLLFLHGFTGTAFEGRDFANYFAEKGYGVWVPLLPGHGTTPEDLNGIDYQIWIKTAEHYYQEMCRKYATVYVCGQSMGGALALHLAANYPVKAVVTMACAIIMKDWRLSLLPLAKRFIEYQHKSRGPNVSEKSRKTEIPTYHKYSISSLQEFLKLIGFVKTELPRVECPALIVHSRKDHTITYDNLPYIMAHISSPRKESLTLEKSYHLISLDRERLYIFDTVNKFLENIPSR